MTARDLFASIRRRWYLLLGGLVATALLCGLAYSAGPVSYEASGSTLLLPPQSSLGTRGNPYLYLGGLGQAAEVLGTRVNAPEVMGPIEEQHPKATIEAGLDTSSTGPIFTVTVTSNSAADTLGTLTQVMGVIGPTLQSMQQELDVNPSSQITQFVLTTDSEPQESTKVRDRLLVVAGAVGLSGTVLLIGLVDGLLLPRRSSPEVSVATTAAATGPGDAAVAEDGGPNGESVIPSPQPTRVTRTSPAGRPRRVAVEPAPPAEERPADGEDPVRRREPVGAKRSSGWPPR